MEKYIVYEYTEHASLQYQGVRFMTSYNGTINPNADPEGHPEDRRLKVIAKDIDENEATKLCDETLIKNLKAHLSEYPPEFWKLIAKDEDYPDLLFK